MNDRKSSVVLVMGKGFGLKLLQCSTGLMHLMSTQPPLANHLLVFIFS